ncbi:unnamed protein product [Clavelina lepadiformis]|uniref:ASD2 domain-containing protein n=1 Tax=Clavelina lepadiformis TaxID=159417 RepID=A0ABP0GZ73_CLALP
MYLSRLIMDLSFISFADDKHKRKCFKIIYALMAPNVISTVQVCLHIQAHEQTIHKSKLKRRTCPEVLPDPYYKTSASKGKIMSLAKERIATNRETFDESKFTTEEIIQKKIDLVFDIKWKLDELQIMRDLLEIEITENERLGKDVRKTIGGVCSKKEETKYNILVHDLDNIINLLLSISGRLTRVENAIQMLPSDAEAAEKELLRNKRQKLLHQYQDAKDLKEAIDVKQNGVSGLLFSCLNRDQFADFEHYIKMKTALIVERRELDDKVRLGEEQMQCLKESLPEDWQINLDRMLEEDEV